MRRFSVLTLGLLVATGACSDESPTQLQPQFASASSTGQAGEAHYRVSIYNLSSGQPLTPPVTAVHRRSLSLFEVGSAATFEVQSIAENGNINPLVDFASTNKHVTDASVTTGPTVPPVLPGEMVEYEVMGQQGAKYLSFVSMLICTNDGFTGANSIRLPKAVGESTSVMLSGYDAGTEINTEAFQDLVPPCGPLTGFDSMGLGTGMSNPDLAEGGVITMHQGISGDADLQGDPHDFDGPVAQIMIERIG